jgi:CHRD domain
MRRKAFSVVVCLVALGVMVSLATAAGTSAMRVKAALNAKQQVPPQVVSAPRASGLFAGTFTKTKKGYRLNWRLTLKNLSSKATSAVVHRGRPGKHGPPLWVLCAPCSSGAHGAAYASPGEVGLVSSGRTYVSVETKKNRAGEIRGQIKVS